MSEKISPEQRCYTEGYRHYQMGTVNQCPYPQGSDEETWWVQGFWDASLGKRNKFT